MFLELKSQMIVNRMKSSHIAILMRVDEFYNFIHVFVKVLAIIFRFHRIEEAEYVRHKAEHFLGFVKPI